MPDSNSNRPDAWATPGGKLAVTAHEYLAEFVRSSDQKAGFLLASSAGLLAFLALALPQKGANEYALVIEGFAVVVTLVAAVLSALTIWPRQPDVRCGLIAWEGILSTGCPNAYHGRIEKLEPPEWMREITNHNYELAKILRRKYCLLRWSARVFIAGGVLTLFAVFMARLVHR